MRVATSTIAAMALAVTPGTAVAAPGALDPSFSGDGWTRTLEVRSASHNYLPEPALDVAIAPGGGIVTAGELQDGRSEWYFGAFRFLAGGDLDGGFGEGGWVDNDIGSFEMPRAVAVQPDGRIVVAGSSDCADTTCFTLARYLPGGALDPAFGADGIAQTTFPQRGAEAFDVAVARDGKIVAAGFTRRGSDGQDSVVFAVARFLPDGRLDPSFSRDGHAIVDFGYGNDEARAIAITPSGKIVVAGSAGRVRHATLDDFAIARVRVDGRLDRSFAGDGRSTMHFGKRRGAARTASRSPAAVGSWWWEARRPRTTTARRRWRSCGCAAMARSTARSAGGGRCPARTAATRAPCTSAAAASSSAVARSRTAVATAPTGRLPATRRAARRTALSARAGSRSRISAPVPTRSPHCRAGRQGRGGRLDLHEPRAGALRDALAGDRLPCRHS